MPGPTLNQEPMCVLERLVTDRFESIIIECVPLLFHIQELICMMKGTHEKGWTWVNTGAQMLCMMLNKSGTALRDELNLVLRE